ncbi:MAG: hypothetical protein ABII97_01570 [Patescibacteria group bacterium]
MSNLENFESKQDPRLSSPEKLPGSKRKEQQFYEEVTPLQHVLEDLSSKYKIVIQSDVPIKEEVLENTTRKRQKISSHHHRSLQERGSGEMVWGAEVPGGKTILLSSRDEKGVPHGDKIGLNKRLRVDGLLDLSPLLNMQERRDLMLRNGLPTEVITDIKEITHMRVNGKKMDTNKFKEFLVEEARKKGVSIGTERFTRFMRGVTIVIAEREMPVGERLLDVLTCKKKEDLEKILKHVFVFINTKKYLKKKNEKLPPEQRVEYCDLENDPKIEGVDKLDYKNEEHIVKYFTEYLPTRMARYLARMHKEGLGHRYASSHNWLLSGDLCDLDSVIESYGDPFDLDLTKTVKALENTLDFKNGLTQSYLKSILKKHRINGAQEAVALFNKEYLKAYEEEKKKKEDEYNPNFDPDLVHEPREDR